MRPIFVVAISAFFLLVPLVSRALADDADTCVNGSGDEKISACTRAIGSGRWTGTGLAWAYANRGNAYDRKGQIDRAIQDLDQAIRLNPSYALAFNYRGIAYDDKGQDDLAIQDYDQAIRLDPNYAEAFNNRGFSYKRKGQYDLAIQDYDQAIRLNSNFADPFSNRGDAYSIKGQYDRAILDYDQVIRLNPQNSWAYSKRGHMNLYVGDLPKAIADLSQASTLNPKDAYVALLLDVAGQRGNLPSRLPQAVTQLDMTAWPAPVIQLFLGHLMPAAVLAAADNPDPKTKRGQVCEANFYSGEFALRSAATGEAIRLFRLAANDCPKDFDEFDMANVELKALGAASSAAPAQSQSFSIYFDSQKSDLTPIAKQIAAAIKDLFSSSSRVTIVGHCDTAEADADNLSFTRAVEVRKALVALGLPAGIEIAVVGKGATELQAPTGPHVDDPRNRYVSITIEAQPATRATGGDARQSDALKLDLVTDCDRLAGSPIDPQRSRGVEGIDFNVIPVGPAFAACKTAMAQYPDVARFIFQAGRVADAQGDYATAREFYEKAASAGEPSAMENLGLLHMAGLTVTQDFAEARRWFEKAAAANEPSAMFNVGVLYESGQGVARDYTEAKKWYEKAAAAGSPNAVAALKNLTDVHQR